MFDFLEDMFGDLDYTVITIALVFYALCLLMIWKFFDATIMKFYIKVLMTVIMLPICYVIVNLMANK